MVWKRKTQIWIGISPLILLCIFVTGQDSETVQAPAFQRSAISDAKISVLINKREWDKILQYGNAAVEPLIKALKDNDEVIRAETAEELGIIGDKRALGPLIETLKDKNRHVRQQAAKALGKLGSNQAVEPLSKCLNDPSRDVRLEVVESLKNLADEWAFKYLLKSLNDSDASVRREAVKALLMTGGRRAVQPFLEYLKDPASKSKIEVIRALGVIGDKRAVEPMISFLKDDDPAIRMWSVEVLRRLGDERAVEPLKRCLNDPEPIIRDKAAEAVNKLQAEIKTVEAARPVAAAAPRVDKKTEAPAAAPIAEAKPPSQVSVASNDQPAVKEQSQPAETVKEADKPKIKKKAAEASQKNLPSFWIYGIIGGIIAALGVLGLIGFFARRKKPEEISRELDSLALQIREISRKKTNNSMKDAALNLLEAHAEAFVHFPSDAGSREEKRRNLETMDESISQISKMLGTGHQGLRLLYRMRTLLKNAIEDGSLDKVVQRVKDIAPAVPPGDAGSNMEETADSIAIDIHAVTPSNEVKGDVPEYAGKAALPKMFKSMTHCAKCRCTVTPAGPAIDEEAERILLEQSKPQKGILALKKQAGEGLLVKHLKKNGLGMFCCKCPTAWCPSCINPDNPSTCRICNNDMVIYRKK